VRHANPNLSGGPQDFLDGIQVMASHIIRRKANQQPSNTAARSQKQEKFKVQIAGITTMDK
jgi:hypothetical protein